MVWHFGTLPAYLRCPGKTSECLCACDWICLKIVNRRHSRRSFPAHPGEWKLLPCCSAVWRLRSFPCDVPSSLMTVRWHWLPAAAVASQNCCSMMIPLTQKGWSLSVNANSPPSQLHRAAALSATHLESMRRFLTPTHSLPHSITVPTSTYVRESTHYIKFGENPFTEDFWAGGWNITLCDFLLRDADMHSAYTATWLAGWLSVTRRYCIKTAKPSWKRFLLYESAIILVSWDPCAYTKFHGEPLQRRR